MTDMTAIEIGASPLDEYLSAKEAPEWHRREVGRYHPSRLVYCLYRQWLDFKEPPVYDRTGSRAAWVGNLIHQAITSDVLPKITKLFKPLFWEKEVFWGLDSVPGAFILGRMDGIVLTPTGELAVLEIKSTKMLEYVTAQGASQHHARQLNFYMGAANIARGILWYIGRTQVDDHFVQISYSRDEFDWVVAQAKMIHSCLVSDTAPPPCPVYSWECSYCNRASQCPKQGRDSRGPGIPASSGSPGRRSE